MGARADGKPITPYEGSWAATVNTTPLPDPPTLAWILGPLNPASRAKVPHRNW